MDESDNYSIKTIASDLLLGTLIPHEETRTIEGETTNDQIEKSYKHKTFPEAIVL